jgi:hypothetical protein
VTGGRALFAAVVLLALTAPPGYAQSVDAKCDTSAGQDECGHWYRGNQVYLHWVTSGLPTMGCSNELFTAEARVQRSCVVVSGSKSAGQTVWLGIDRTPPRLVAPIFDRASDRGAWFNHPVDLTFRASDQTSGVASCSSSLFAGPDGAGRRVGGTCTDVAGNVGSGLFFLNYDATAPTKPKLSLTPGSGFVRASWSSSEPVDVTLSRTRAGRPPVIVYRGSGGSYTDRHLHNQRTYRYTVAVVDRAGNRAQNGATVVPTASRLYSPARGAHVGFAPRLRWKHAKRARYYNVQLFRGRHKILSRWPKTTSLQVHRKWSYGGHRRRLSPGRYSWFVWPGYGRRSANRFGHMLGKSTFVVTH